MIKPIDMQLAELDSRRTQDGDAADKNLKG